MKQTQIHSLLVFIAATFLANGLFSLPAGAADANGYTARYECRAGGANCNVDIATLVGQQCQQTITTSDSPTTISAKINGGSRFICIQPGDYTGKGTITVTSSGTAGARKVLRYDRLNDNNDDPWNQGSNQAKLYAINLNHASYWVVHRVTVVGLTGSTSNVLTTGPNADNNIFNRILAENGGSSEGIVNIGTANNNVLQNSVVRNGVAAPGYDNACVTIGAGQNLWAVNNELYNCTKMVFSWQHVTAPGMVVENNDIYMTPDFYTDCSGRASASGPCSKGENGISLKSPATATNPGRMIHNRIWGIRPSDISVCCGGGGTQGDTIDLYSSDSENPGDGVDWILIENNIIFDGQKGYLGSGFGSPGRDDNISVVGNLFWNFQPHVAGYDVGAIFATRHTSSEFDSNTIISASGNSLVTDSGPNNDFFCNVTISSGPAAVAGSGSTVDHNAYYSSSDAGEPDRIATNIRARANSTVYSLDDIVSVGGSCDVANNPSCFLYKVTVAGTSASSAPTYCVKSGCVTTDGGVKLQPIRQPYVFRRKLHTVPGGEVVVVPYALPNASAPEAFRCPIAPGTTRGVGVTASVP